MNSIKKLYIAGHTGMVGSSVLRLVENSSQFCPITATWQELDLTDFLATCEFLNATRPDAIIIAAARVGGIMPNATFPAEFLHENLAIAHTIIHSAFLAKVPRVLFLGSSCIYPRLCPQPIREEYLLTGPLEPTNEPYALAKIAGLKLCQYYRKRYGVCYHSAMPCNLYGPEDNYDLDKAHALPALIRKFHEAKLANDPTVTLWGSGLPKREFLHVDDLARALLFLLEINNPPDWVNIGSGHETTIKELALLIQSTVGHEGILKHDPSKPDGTPRKLLDSTLMRSLGWSPTIPLREGLRGAYQTFQQEIFATAE